MLAMKTMRLFRVWLRANTPDGVGHASLQTFSDINVPHRHRTVGQPGIYASFWPARGKSRADGKYNFWGRESELLQGLAIDESDGYEGRPPDVKVSLFSLDIGKINEEFSKFKETVLARRCNWSVFGSTFFGSTETQNCSGLVNYLLTIGGILNLVSRNRDITTKGGVILGAGAEGFIGLGGVISLAGETTTIGVFAGTMLVGMPIIILGGVAVFYAAGYAADTVQEVGAIATPDGIYNLVKWAYGAERSNYTHRTSKCEMFG